MTREETIAIFKAFIENPLFSDEHKQAFNIAIHDIKQRHEWDVNNLILVNKDNYESLEREPCEDAISRQAVKEQMLKYGFYAPDMTVTEFAEDLSPVTPQQKTGHWITEIKSDRECGPIKPRCSECGGEPYYSNSIYDYEFCPYCGAKMVKARQFAELVAAEIGDEWELVKPQQSEVEE